MIQSVLLQQIKSKIFLCVGLDVDQERMPLDLKDDPDSIFTFCKKKIIKRTHKPISPTLLFLSPVDQMGESLKK